MNHHPAKGESIARPIARDLGLPMLDRSPQNEEDELTRLRRLVERQYRAAGTLARVLKGRSAGKQEGNRVQLVSRVPKAKWITRPIAVSLSDRPTWWRAPQPTGAPLVAPTGYDCQSLERSMQEQVGFSVRGLKGADLESVIASIADEQRRTRTFRPVFITDQSELSPFMRRGFAVEYVSPDRGFDQKRQAERWEEVKEFCAHKWSLSRIVDRDNARALDRDYAPAANIAQHNADMSRACHRDRFAWMAETLRIAIATERYDVAGDLGDHLLTAFDKIPSSTQLAVAKSLCRKFLAFGETDLLQRFLFKIHTRVASDDFLFTLFSAHCTTPDGFVGQMAHLPSGKLNAYYVSKRLRSAGDDILPNFLDKETATPDANFVLANFFATRRHPELYRLFVNRGLGHVGVAQIKKATFASDNILSTVAFEKPAPARHQAELVSIIMSCHNSRATIVYAARSILEQSYKNIELLICDDNPDAPSLDALGHLGSDPRLRLFTSKSPQGTYNIRNNLIPLARGNIITFQDSDDVAFPNRIESQVDHLKETGAAAVCSLWYRISKTGEFVFSIDHAVSRLAVVSLMASRAVFEAAGPYRSARFGADTEYFEALKQRFGPGSVLTQRVPLLFGLSSETSLTRRAGMEASEDGYRSPARRAYAAASSRRRLVSWESNDAQLFEQRLADLDVLVASAGVVEAVAS